MSLSQLPALLSAWLTDISAARDRRPAPRRLLLFVGALFAKGRHTVTSWFRPDGIRTDFRRSYAALWAAGRRIYALRAVVSRCQETGHNAGSGKPFSA
jgi:hypothetical protein